jgi:hypothetical protein
MGVGEVANNYELTEAIEQNEPAIESRTSNSTSMDFAYTTLDEFDQELQDHATTGVSMAQISDNSNSLQNFMDDTNMTFGI